MHVSVSYRLRFLQGVASALAVALALIGCGGGGGSGASPPPPSGGSPLVPLPASPGAVLANSALDLRPLRDTAAYEYRGKDFTTPAIGRSYTAYTSSVTQTAVGGEFQEAATNLYRVGAAQSRKRVVGSDVLSVDTIGLTAAIVVANHTSTELRSPVRQNDQYTVFERSGFDFGQDLDRDGKNESADIAIYCVVIGAEAITVPAMRGTTAVRVDTIVRVRIVPTSAQASPSIAESVESVWYVPGVGIAKRSLRIGNSGRPVEATEELVNWDGVSEGLGVTGSTDLRLPPPSGAVLGGPAQVVGFDNHALVITPRSNTFGAAGPRVTKIDVRGRAVSTYEYPNLQVGLSGSNPLIRWDDRAYWLTQRALTAGLTLVRFDSEGQILDDPVTGINIPVGNPPSTEFRADVGPAMAVVGNELWIAWARSRLVDAQTGTYQLELVARPFDRNGQPLAPETVVLSDDVQSLTAPRMVSDGTRALLVTIVNSGTTMNLLTRSSGSPILASSPLANPQVLSFANPVRIGVDLGVIWLGAFSSTRQGFKQINGVRVGPSGVLDRGFAGSSLDTEDLPGDTLDPYGVPLILLPTASGLAVASDQQVRLWEEDLQDQRIYAVGEIAFSSAPWSQVATYSQVVRVPVPGGDRAIALVSYPDRLVLISYGDVGQSSVNTRVIWRRSLN